MDDTDKQSASADESQRPQLGSTDFFSTEKSFSPPIGSHWTPGEPPRGYYIDFAMKTDTPAWPPAWLERDWHVTTAQWGLGAFERFVKGEGEAWLEGACSAGEYLLEQQVAGGPKDGGWLHQIPMPHSYVLEPPWISAISQGEGASLLTRLHLETGEERFADGARRALAPMALPAAEGGTFAELDGGPFVEEYPTDPPCYVLNGAIFGIWGYYDVAQGLDDADAAANFDALAGSLARSMPRFDTGFWSRYDLFPHPIRNVASPAYHLLHIKQLRVLDRLAPGLGFGAVAERFERYRGSRVAKTRALAHKIVFRLLVPRRRPARPHKQAGASR